MASVERSLGFRLETGKGPLSANAALAELSYRVPVCHLITLQDHVDLTRYHLTVSPSHGITGGESRVRPLQHGSKSRIILTVSCRVLSSSGSVNATDNDVTARNNATPGIEDAHDVWDVSTEQTSASNDHVDESDVEEDFTFPGAETLPTRKTPPSPSPQPSKSALNPAAVPFTFRPAVPVKPAEVSKVEEPAELPEPTVETPHVQDVADDSDDEEFHFPGAEKLPDPIPAPVSSPSPQEPMQVLSPVPENPLLVVPASLAATSPAITTQSSPDLGPLSKASTSVSTPAPPSSIPSPLPPPPPPKRKPTQAQLEALYAAASSNDLPLLRKLFKNACQDEDVEEFALANDAAVRTGLTALHAASSRGYLEIVQWRELISLQTLMRAVS